MKKIVLIGAIAIIAVVSGLSFKDKKDLPVFEHNDAVVKELPIVKNEAFRRGEKLTFRLHYGIIDAGVATLGITDEAREINGRKTYHVVGIGKSKGAFDWFFKVRDRYETYIDEKAMVPWVFLRDVQEGGYKTQQSYAFNHYNNKVNVGGGEVLPIEPNMQDMLSAFYAARTMDLSNARVNDIYTMSCFVDKEIWPLKIKFVGRETITTDLGTFRCLKFRPIVQQGRVFKHEEDLNVWITDDKNHIPIKGQADVLVGSIKMELTGYSGLAAPVAKVN